MEIHVRGCHSFMYERTVSWVFVLMSASTMGNPSEQAYLSPCMICIAIHVYGPDLSNLEIRFFTTGRQDEFRHMLGDGST